MFAPLKVYNTLKYQYKSTQFKAYVKNTETILKLPTSSTLTRSTKKYDELVSALRHELSF